MLLKQYYLGCLAHASYMIADESARAAAIVDPQRDVDQYLEDARRQNLSIRYVILTHFHADFVAGHLELRDRAGATVCLGARGKAEYAFQPLADGDTLDLGQVRLQALETPGHSPESICLLVYDSRRKSNDRQGEASHSESTWQKPAGRLVYDLTKSAGKPHAVLTGDTLFIGDVGRPDLRASLGWTAEELGSLLYDSLHEKLLKLPDETRVYPAHGAGSMCGKNLSTETVSTIGVQRRYNYALQPMSRDEFIRLVVADQPEAPAYFTYDAILNTKERPTLDRTLQKVLTPLSLDEVLRLKNAGAQLLDVRNAADFAGAHLADSINIGLGGQYASWAGTLLDKDRPIVLIADPGTELEAATRLGRIGFDNVAGYLQGGMQAFDQRPDLLRRTNRIAAPTLAEKLAAANPPVVLDVRTPREWQTKRIEGSLHIPLSRLRERIEEVPRDRPIVIHCQTGYRSSTAASLLEQHGLASLADLVGGLAAWEASGLAVAGDSK